MLTPKVKVSSFTEVITGGTPSTMNSDYWSNGTIPWLNSGDLNTGEINNANNYITELGLRNSSTKLMPPGTVLVALTGATTGVTGILNIEACANQSVTGILPSDKHDPKFLYYFFKTQRNKILRKCWGGAQPHINQKFIKEYTVPLPPISEQRHIANILSKAESLIAKRKESIRLLDEFLKSTFLEMFGDPVRNEKGWEKKKLKDVADILTGFAFKSKNYSNNESDVKICGGLIVFPGRINWNDATTWPKEDTIGLEKYWLKAGDIIIALDRPWISSGFKLAMIKKNDPESLLIQRTARIRTEKISIEYLYFLLNHRIFKQHCKPTETTVPHISPTEIQCFEIPIPPEVLQSKFSEIVERVEIIKNYFVDSLMDLEHLYGSVNQKMFGRS